jgi:thiamine-monophosphate kinase
MSRDETAMGPGGEFDLVREMLARWGDAAAGIGDDAAVLQVPEGERLVVSTDASVERVHFRRDWMSAAEIGYRATAAALSDLAAMAARPLGIVVALALPREWVGEVGALADGIGEAARESGVPIVGGNLSRAGELSLTTTVFGSGRRLLARAGARAGDRIYVTGRLGGPLLALRALERGDPLTGPARARLVRPDPRLEEARWLAAHGATAAIDVSDGLLADLGHLAAASGAHIAVELDAIPIVPGASPEDAARSGEEYELALAGRIDAHAFRERWGIPLTEIGRVTAGPAGVEATLAGRRVAPPSGHDHFSS